MAPSFDQVEKALEKTRSVLRSDGGDVELVDVSPDGIIQVRLKGACHGCPMATMTLKSTHRTGPQEGSARREGSQGSGLMALSALCQ